MNLRSTIFTATIATLLSYSVSSAADVPIQVRNKTDLKVKVELTILDSSVSEKKLYRYTIEPNKCGKLLSGENPLRASRVQYAYSTVDGMRAPGDPSLVYIHKVTSDEHEIVIDIDVNEVRHPTATERQRQQEREARVQRLIYENQMRMLQHMDNVTRMYDGVFGTPTFNSGLSW